MNTEKERVGDTVVNEKEHIARQVENLDGNPVQEVIHRQPAQRNLRRQAPEPNLSWLV